MFGEDILVAPKLSLPYSVSQPPPPSSEEEVIMLPTQEDMRYLVNVAFPEYNGWFNYFTKRLVNEDRQELHLTYDQCCGLYVRAGSVLPIKLHDGALSLERAHTLPIRLEVYLDPVSQNASGTLYLDDGDTFDYLKGERALIHFWYEPATHTLMMN